MFLKLITEKTMKISLTKVLLLLFVTLLTNLTLWSNENIVFHEKDLIKDISSQVLIYEDKTGELSISSIQDKEFKTLDSKVPNFGVSKSYFWVKLPITNNSNIPELLIEVSLPILDYIEFYSLEEDGYNKEVLGESFIFSKRKYNEPNYLFDVIIPKGSSKTYYLRVASNEAIQLPIKLGTKNEIITELKYRDILSGIYVGIMVVMILYNLFIYFSVKDQSYIYYVVYIVCILLTQTSLQGYTFQFLWPNTPVISKYSLFLFPAFSAVSGMLFMNVFLKTKNYFKKLNNLSYLLIIPFLFSITITFFSHFNLSQIIMEANSGLVSIYMLAMSILVLRRGYRPARFFLVAWIIFLVGVFAFIMKDLEVLPFNNFTRYTMQIGSAIETILLSFALAARINTYKKQRLEVLKINEKIIREQNTMLERKVKERTEELNETLNNLKSTQSQLVEAEKMSSLGQLTAGIAHEINNPINFVSSNIYPLRQDIKDMKEVIAKYEELEVAENFKDTLDEIRKLKEELDYDYLKEELDTIVNGIEEGALRTAEIVTGLRTFSRLDEGVLKNVDINEGLESTLVLVNSKLNGVKIKKQLGVLPEIECNPGKINQLFMNIIDNAIFAVQKKNVDNEEGNISIETDLVSDDKVRIIIEDNGVGIPDEIKSKLFDPFFTTKAVGEGTGLGMSIVRSIIDEHSGTINVESELNKGTKIEIVLPQKKK